MYRVLCPFMNTAGWPVNHDRMSYVNALGITVVRKSWDKIGRQAHILLIRAKKS